MSHLVSKNKSIYFLILLAQTKITLFIFCKQLGNKGKLFLLVEPCSRIPKNRGNGEWGIFDISEFSRILPYEIGLFIYLLVCFARKLNFLRLLKPLKMNSSEISDIFERTR